MERNYVRSLRKEKPLHKSVPRMTDSESLLERAQLFLFFGCSIYKMQCQPHIDTKEEKQVINIKSIVSIGSLAKYEQVMFIPGKLVK